MVVTQQRRKHDKEMQFEEELRGEKAEFGEHEQVQDGKERTYKFQ